MLGLHLRDAEFNDWEELLRWRNDDSTREFSKTKDPVDERDHKAWLSNVLDSPDHLLFIVETDDKKEPVGMVRFDRIRTAESEFRVSINLDPSMRGQGLGGRALGMGIRNFDDLSPDCCTIIADIDPQNVASAKIFLANGFERVGRLPGHHDHYQYTRRINLQHSFILERVSGTRSQAQTLFDLLLKREHAISHRKMPSMGEHIEFVLASPYRHWFLVRINETYCGTIYIHRDNSIGVNTQDLTDENLRQLLVSVLGQFTPLPAIRSVRPGHFHINVPIGSDLLEKAVVDLAGQLVQKTYLLSIPEY